MGRSARNFAHVGFLGMPGAWYKVSLTGPCRVVWLLNDLSFQRYRSGTGFVKHHTLRYNRFSLPHEGHWHLLAFSQGEFPPSVRLELADKA